jgi:hypothetical protein
MALSPSEKQKRYRERQKAAKEAARKRELFAPQADDPTATFWRAPINELVHGFDFEEALDALGYENLGSFHHPAPTYSSGASVSLSGQPALERFTGLAEVFLDAARELHQFVNAYKVAEIEARIKELEQAPGTDPAIKELAIARLKDIRAALNREFRRSFPEISVKGTVST